MTEELLEQFIGYISLEKGLSNNTIESYKNDLVDFINFLEIKNVKPTDSNLEGIITLYIIALHDKGISARSIARKLSSIKSFYKFLMRENVIKYDPTIAIERPKLKLQLPQILSIQEVEKLLNQEFPKSAIGLRDKAILETLYGTGIRESELINLELDNVIFDGEFIVVAGKGKKERIVPIGKIALEAINQYLLHGRNLLIKDISCRILFLNNNGQKLSRMGLWKIVRKWSLKAGLMKNISPHTLRHSCATHMLEAGASIIAVQEMLGHADVATTQIYTHLTAKDLKTIHNKAHPRG